MTKTRQVFFPPENFWEGKILENGNQILLLGVKHSATRSSIPFREFSPDPPASTFWSSEPLAGWTVAWLGKLVATCTTHHCSDPGTLAGESKSRRRDDHAPYPHTVTIRPPWTSWNREIDANLALRR